MNKKDQRRASASDQTIENGEMYTHIEHGTVEVTGIWQRTHPLDTTHSADNQDMIIVRYVPGEDGEWMDELAEPLDDFLDAIG